MHYQVAEKLVVENPASFTRAIPMQEGNAVSVEFEVVVYGGFDVTVTIELGNDLQNWKPGDSSSAKDAAGSFSLTSTGLGFQYVRLKITGRQAIVDACIETKRL